MVKLKAVMKTKTLTCKSVNIKPQIKPNSEFKIKL